MNVSKLIAAGALTVALTHPAAAVTITSVNGVWQNANVIGGSADGLGTNALLWGRAPNGWDQSGYTFQSGAASIDTNVDEAFTIGSFTHNNRPIFSNGPTLNSADLAISFTIAGSDETYQSVFSFDHQETLNNARMCANGETRASAVNARGCADSVTAVLNEDASQGFFVDGLEYALDISGFLFADGLLNTFWTQENADNTAALQASYRLISDEATPPNVTTTQVQTLSEVPLPASGLLLLGALAGLAIKRRNI